MSSGRTPWDPSTEYRIVESDSPVTVDGYSQGEPKRLECCFCGASVVLDPDPSTPGIDDLSHQAGCPNRFARSEWWRERVNG